uniref:Uncharacterized protein n=1 Tax=Rhabditophanes sp. KR3021 TaxID=114890 RepID=A0AC35TQS0_9BILA
MSKEGNNNQEKTEEDTPDDDLEMGEIKEKDNLKIPAGMEDPISRALKYEEWKKTVLAKRTSIRTRKKSLTDFLNGIKTNDVCVKMENSLNFDKK